MIISVPVAVLSVVASVAPIVHAILVIVTAPEVEAEAWAAVAGVQVTAAASPKNLPPDLDDLSVNIHEYAPEKCNQRIIHWSSAEV